MITKLQFSYINYKQIGENVKSPEANWLRNQNQMNLKQIIDWLKEFEQFTHNILDFLKENFKNNELKKIIETLEEIHNIFFQIIKNDNDKTLNLNDDFEKLNVLLFETDIKK